MAFCNNCGIQLTQTEGFCSSCGASIIAPPLSSPAAPFANSSAKNKMVSVLLALFFTFFTWLYTYRRDGWKFWIGLILSGLPIIVALILMETMTSTNSDDAIISLGYILPIAIWLWAIIDSAAKSKDWYAGY